MNNGCNRMDRWIDAWIDGQVRGPRVRRIRRHLASCADCRTRVAERREWAEQIRATAAPVPPVDPESFSRGVESAITRDREAGTRAAPHPWIGPMAAWGAAAAVIVGGAVWIGAALLNRPVAGGNRPLPLVRIELDDPSVVPMIEIGPGDVPVVWLTDTDDDAAQIPPG